MSIFPALFNESEPTLRYSVDCFHLLLCNYSGLHQRLLAESADLGTILP